MTTQPQPSLAAIRAKIAEAAALAAEFDQKLANWNELIAEQRSATTQPQPSPHLDLDAIQARADAATGGPWYADHVDGEVYDSEGRPIAQTPAMNGPNPDAIFTAHARTDVPALIARIRDLETELDGRDEEARERWIQKQIDETGIRSMEFRNGAHMDLEPARDLVACWVAAARTLLGDAPNYTETKLEFDVKVAESPEVYTLVVQRHAPGALTPHEARQRAEARVAELEQQLARLQKDYAAEERLHAQTITERDRATEAADRLAAHIAPSDVTGEHSDGNDPWQNALDYDGPAPTAA